jgi:DNA-binding winged helix-turn-helix (wHTH) protein
MILRTGTCHIDTDRRRLVRDGCEQHLSRKAFDLLVALLEARPKVVAKEVLINRVWPDAFVSEANLPVLIGDIRAALGDAAREPRLIRTHHAVGYSFAGEVSEISSAPHAPVGSVAIVLCVGERRMRLPEGTSTLGRDETCDVILPHGSVSRLHAHLTVTDGTLTIADVESKNGTWVDDRRMTEPFVAADDQRVIFGSVETFVRIERPGAGSTLTVGAPLTADVSVKD